MAMIVIGQFKAKDGCIEDLKAVMTSLLEPTRAQPGCGGIQLNQDVDDPECLMFLERWNDLDSFRNHVGSDYVQEFWNQAKPFVAEVTVHRTKRLG